MSAVIEFEHDVERLPASWTKTTLGAALARSEGGGTPPRDVEEYWNGNIPWASVKDVVKGGGVAPEETISDAGLKNSTSKLIPAGTNIFAARMGVGAVARYPFPVAINQDLIALTPSSALDPEFLFFWLQARKEDFVSVATGTTVKGIRKDVLLSFPLFLPPLDEQRRIAEVLRSVDEAIAAAEAALKQQSDMLEAARFQMVGLDGSRADWELKPILECFVLQRGHDLPVQSRSSGDIPVIASNGPVGVHNVPAIAGPSVVTGRSGTIGRVIFYEGPSWPLNTTLFVKDFRKSHPRFVYHFLCAFPLRSYQSGTGVPTLNRNDVHAVEVQWPSRSQQEEIAVALDALETAKNAAEQEHEHLLALKRSVMSDLLSGRVRVPA